MSKFKNTHTQNQSRFASVVRKVVRKLSLVTVLFFYSTQLLALGLGGFEVESHLDEPLRGKIAMRASSGDDLTTLQAAIASREEFANLGVEYADYLGNIVLFLDSVAGEPVLVVSSNDVVIKEPYIQFLVKVNWSGGSFLREYTALIDPPTYAATAPQINSEPRIVGTDQRFRNQQSADQETFDETVNEPVNEPVDLTPSETVGQTFNDSSDTVFDIAGIDQVTSSDSETGSNARYGPVEQGESLSIIAEGLQTQFPDLSIFQIMKVLFEENPSAFIDGNINGLKKGAILDVGSINAIRQVEIADARAFYAQQLQSWNPESLIADSDSTIKVGQSEYADDSELSDDSSFSFDSDSDSFQVGSSSEIGSFVSSTEGDSSEGEVVLLRQEIVDLETSLASSVIENQELSERISILEGQLADMNRVLNLGVEDVELAALESSLANQNTANESTANDDVEADDVEALAQDAEIVDVAQNTTDVGELNALETVLANDEGEVVSQAVEPVAVEPEPVAVEPEPVQPTPASTEVVSFQGNNESWLDTIKSLVLDNDLQAILAGLGGLLLLGLGWFFYRRRRIGYEFGIDNAHSMGSSIHFDDSQGAGKDSSQTTHKDTSFLSVYNDGNAVVQADEVDPIAEADVYIAYGRNEQAEAVLLDSVNTHPTRVDIKLKLLSLYHQLSQTEKFERLAEELYADRATLDAKSWQSVCDMGQEILPNNPLFELPASEVVASDATANAAVAKEAVASNEQAVSDAPPADRATEKVAKQAQTPAEPEDNLGDDYPIVSDLEGVTKESVIEFDMEVKPASPAADPMEELKEQAAKIRKVAIGGSEPKSDALITDDDVQNVSFDDNNDDADSALIQFDEVEPQESDVTANPKPAAVATLSDTIAQMAELEPQSDSEIEILMSDEESRSIQFIKFDENLSHSELDVVKIEAIQQGDGNDQAGNDEDSGLDELGEISDLEIDQDYDEARTQYELAKVYVDLGDDDGAREILKEIVANSNNSDMVLKDSRALLDSIA